MDIYCHICHGKLSILDDYRHVKGLFIHRVTLSPNGEWRYCYDEYNKRRSKQAAAYTMRKAG